MDTQMWKINGEREAGVNAASMAGAQGGRALLKDKDMVPVRQCL
jgi:hypothetical protein